MKTGWNKTALLPGLFILLATVWLGGCSSTPPAPERPDSGKIQKNSDKSMQDLSDEEERRGGTGY